MAVRRGTPKPTKTGIRINAAPTPAIASTVVKINVIIQAIR
jgi:hypothetical protein